MKRTVENMPGLIFSGQSMNHLRYDVDDDDDDDLH
jgi:hypothetical protein